MPSHSEKRVSIGLARPARLPCGSRLLCYGNPPACVHENAQAQAAGLRAIPGSHPGPLYMATTALLFFEG
jgi:hypothetical protein